MIFTVLGFHACTDSEDDLYSPEQGIYVLSRGDGNSWSVSLYQFSTEEVLTDYFKTKNSSENISGEEVLDMVNRRSNAYILAKKGDASGVIRVVNYAQFNQTAKIELDFAPSAMVFITDSLIAISKASEAEVAIYDIKESKVTRTLQSLTHKPGQLLIKGKYLYVASTESDKVSVVEHSSDVLKAEIPTSGVPENFVMDGTDNLWVYSHTGGLTKVKHLSWETSLISETFNFSTAAANTQFNIGISPSLSYIYYFENGLKRHFINNNTLPERNLIDGEAVAQYLGFTIDNKSGNIYYLSEGEVTDRLIVYNSSSSKIKEIRVGKGAMKTFSYY